MAGQRHDLSLPRSAEAPTRLWTVIEGLSPLQGAGDAARFRVELVLTEVLTNILRHSGGVAPIRVRIRERERGLQVLIASDGVAFDMSRADAALPAELLAEGGRGLFLIRECASHLRYRRQGGWNLHRMVFFVEAD
ncbi:MAG: ATP-binding protein [Xanthomonadales bacterium]|jgi:anti-sigma regulatory factor (Ser/Thr protein kinase)|nr:ATP-binding protein [Xanthomonadales bacterium]